MSAAVQDIIARAAALTAAERAEVVRHLADEAEPNAEEEAAFWAEIDCRMAGIRSGTTVGIPAEEVFARRRRTP